MFAARADDGLEFQRGRAVHRHVGACEADAGPACIWTQGLAERFEGIPTRSCALPIAATAKDGSSHPRDGHADRMLRRQVASPMWTLPNGSEADVAASAMHSGRILRLMPHPERFLDGTAPSVLTEIG